MAAALVATQSYSAPKVADLYARVRTLCEEPSLLGWVVTGQWTCHLTRGELTLALRDAGELVAQARDDVIIKLIGCNSSTGTWTALGDFAKARFYGEQGVPFLFRSVTPMPMFGRTICRLPPFYSSPMR